MKKIFLLLLFCIIMITTYAQTLTVPQLINKIENSVFTVYAENEKGNVFSQGSGFVIGINGVCITNFHVLENAHSGYVQNKDGEKFKISKIIDYDADCDLVKFQIENTTNRQFYALPVSMTIPPKGEDIVSLSTPMGLEQTVSTGIVSSIRETQLYGTTIQITAPISHGSSGSPILNKKGEVLGVSTFGYGEGQSLNFAVSVLNFSKISQTKNLNLQDITRNPLETTNIRKVRTAILEGNYDIAFELAKSEYDKNNKNHLVLSLIANIYLETKDYESAIDAILEAIDIAPENASYFNLCGLAFTHKGYAEYNTNNDETSFKYALQSYEKAISLGNDPIYYYNRGHLIFELFFTFRLLNTSSLYDAMNNFNTCLQLNPYYEAAYVRRAEVKQNLSDYWGAIADCDKAIGINPYYYRSYLIRGDTKGYFLKDQQAGIKDLDIALSLVNTKKEKADVLGLKATQEYNWANKIIREEKSEDFDLAVFLLNDAKVNFQEAYNLSGDKMYLDRLNQVGVIAPIK